jgi:hypothetical protein
MKTNGCSFFILAFLWLINSPVAISQLKGINHPDIQDQKNYSQISAYPEDLISVQVKNSPNYRQSHNECSEPGTIVPDSIIYYSSLALSSKEIYSYDVDGNLITHKKQTMGISGWQNSEMSVYQYDPSGNLLSETKRTWAGLAWKNEYLLTYTYDEWGNIETYLVRKWDTGDWQNISLFTYTYEGGRNLLSQLEQYWNGGTWNNGNWENSSVSVNHYDELGYLDYSVRMNWISEKWTNSVENRNTFNLQGRIISSVELVWNGTTWFNSLMKNYSYDNEGNNLVYCEQFWGNTVWINYSMITRAYDYDANVISELYQEWMGDWMNISNCIFSYDIDGNCSNEVWFFWNNDTWQASLRADYDYADGLIRGLGYYWDKSGWVRGDAMLDINLNSNGKDLFFCEWWGSNANVYYSMDLTGTTEPSVPQSDVTVYPNPARDRIFFNVNDNENINDHVMVEVFNVAGEKMSSLSVENHSNLNNLGLDISDLNSGIYFLSITSGNKYSIQKFAVQK